MILNFNEITEADLALVGGKAAQLGWLVQAGYRVPPGFVILSSTFQNGGLLPTAWEEVQGLLQRMRARDSRIRFAVRSSARREDLPTASFAGEYETYLNLKTDQEILQAIERVYQSRRSERVFRYREAMNIASDLEMAVIVQQMVPAELAGVLFTADPVNGSRNFMTGNYVHGLGDRLVSGEENPEIFKLDVRNGAYQGPSELKPHAADLFKIGQDLTTHLGGPQDIEWVVSAGTVHLLQTRPVSTMQPYNPETGEWNDSLRGEYLWSNANFGEAIPGVMTPLTWSVVQIYAQETFSNPLPGDNPLMGNLGGRFYINLSLFASFMKSIGFSRERMNRESEEFFGNLPDDIDIPLIPFSRWEVLRRFGPFAIKAISRRRSNLRDLSTFTASIPDRVTELSRTIEAAPRPDLLAHIWQVELEPLLRNTYQMLQAGTSQYKNAYRPLRLRLLDQVGEEDANLLLSGVSGEGEHLASLGLLVGVAQVAAGEISRTEFFDCYGHRGEHEFELSRPRLAEDPDWLDEQLKNTSRDKVQLLLEGREAQKQAAWERYEMQYPREASRVQAKLAGAARAARRREAIRSETSRLLALIRAFALRAGALTGLGEGVFFLDLEELIAGLLGNPFPDSAIQVRRRAHERLSALPPYPSLIVGRFDPYRWAADPDRQSDLFDGRPGFDRQADGAGVVPERISGLPGSAGIAEGSVRKLTSLAEGHLLEAGEILVTTTPNVGWTPLFPRAAAVVTDVGAPLSHAAIVARELGIPAVVGTGNATMRLQTGEWVRVDGAKGVVVRLKDDNLEP